MRSIAGAIYLLIGVVIAANKGYVGELDGIGEFINLLLAVVLWPLVLVGVKFNLHFGGGGSKDNDALGSAFLLVGPAVTYGRSALTSTGRNLGHMLVVRSLPR